MAAFRVLLDRSSVGAAYYPDNLSPTAYGHKRLATFAEQAQFSIASGPIFRQKISHVCVFQSRQF